MKRRLQRLEAVQAMVLEIGKISADTNELREFLHAIHLALSKIMYAKNFYIALYNPDDESIQFAYFLDEVDPPPDPGKRFKLEAPGSALTKWVIVQSKAADGWQCGNDADYGRRSKRHYRCTIRALDGLSADRSSKAHARCNGRAKL